MKLYVTGEPDGRSVLVEEREPVGLAASMAPDLVNVPLFAVHDVAKILGPEGSGHDEFDFFPVAGQARFFQLDIAPASAASSSAPTPEQLAEADALFPGLFARMEVDDPGMHRTDTVEFITVLSGRGVLELDDGERRTIVAGDHIVQRGTRHRWLNESDESLRMAVVMLGVER